VFIPPGIDRASIHPFRILIIGPNSIECARDSFDAVRAIKNGRPDANTTVLTLDSLADVWRENAAVDTIETYNGQDTVFAIARKLRANNTFDVSISFSADWKTALAARLAGVPLRVGLRRGPNAILCNQHPPIADGVEGRALYLQVAWSVGADISALAV
jgi:ADP-heptose:LPS heptosyltransferase